MSKTNQKTKSENNNQNIAPVSWLGLFIGAFFTGCGGGFFITYAGFRMASEIARIGYYYDKSIDIMYLLGIVLLGISIFLGVFALKEMIAESIVRAMEVYHGKKRVIENKSEKDADRPSLFSWNE